jgi:hypothetical protein
VIGTTGGGAGAGVGLGLGVGEDVIGGRLDGAPLGWKTIWP